MMDKNRKILLMDILQGAVVIFLVGWLCYRNLIASLAGMVVRRFLSDLRQKRGLIRDRQGYGKNLRM